MIGLAEARWPVWRFLRDELTVSPSRWSRMVRMTAVVTIVTIVSMALRVPEVAVSAFLIFLASASDVKTTVRVGVGATIAVTIAVVLTLVFYSLTLAEPALRVPAMAGVVFAGMYLMRLSAAGPLVWIIGFVTAYALTFGDRGIPPEILTREVLWVWVFVVYPLALLIIVDVLFGRRPEDVFRDGIAERLEAAAALLDTPAAEEPSARRRAERLERAGTGSLSAYVKAGPPSGAAARGSILPQIDLLFLLLREIPAEAKRAPEMRGALARAGEACRDARKALLGDEGVAPERFASLERETGGGAAPAAALAVVLPLLACVEELGLAILETRQPAAAEAQGPARPGAPAPSESASPPVDKSEAARFAAKATLAAMIAYIFYTSVQWGGIHTAMLTCLIVAQPSLGATIHKLTLRIVGALVGAALGIGAIVFVLPHLETIGGLCVLVASVTVLGAWIATGSQAISYAGVQLVFAFYMTVLQGFSRTSEMSVGRDRVIGILLGNVLISVVFMKNGPCVSNRLFGKPWRARRKPWRRRCGSEAERRPVPRSATPRSRSTKTSRRPRNMRRSDDWNPATKMVGRLSPPFNRCSFASTPSCVSLSTGRRCRRRRDRRSPRRAKTSRAGSRSSRRRSRRRAPFRPIDRAPRRSIRSSNSWAGQAKTTSPCDSAWRGSRSSMQTSSDSSLGRGPHDVTTSVRGDRRDAMLRVRRVVRSPGPALARQGMATAFERSAGLFLAARAVASGRG
jgi:multidrug resistance protein MdtO